MRRLVDRHLGAFTSGVQPVLCHNDCNDANLLVAAAGEPHVSGIVDFERASWDDPLTDLARTKLHANSHNPAAAEVLVEAYGLRGDDELRRLTVHEVLHALEERVWITRDRPPGWERSIASLDAFLVRST